MNTSIIKIKKTLAVFLALSSVAAVVHADDTEVFYSVNVSKPNVMFVLDISGSMGSSVPGTGKNRMQVMKDAFSGVMAAAPDNVKIGLINYGEVKSRGFNVPLPAERFRQHSVSGVAFPVTDINALAKPITDASGTGNILAPDTGETIREYLPRVVNSWSERSWTPIVGALYETALYFRGEKMHFGLTSPATSGAHPATYNGPTITADVSSVGRDNIEIPGVVVDPLTGQTLDSKYKYISPIESSCQENYIVLMTDGGPTYITNNGEWGSYTTGPFDRVIKGNSSFSSLAGNISSCDNVSGDAWPGKCGSEITHYLAANDNIPSPSQSRPNGQFGDQFIKTYVVGFGSGLSDDAVDYLKSLETIDDDPNTGKVEDGYFEADDPAKLIETFTNILSDIATPKGTLASPGYSVNVKSGLEHEKDIYIPVFDRKNSARWAGNLKKFSIVEVGNKRLIRGKNNRDAVDSLGGFTYEAWDLWSDTPSGDGPDGAAIQKGGSAGKLDPADRLLVSNLSDNNNLTATANLIVPANHTRITNDLLDIDSGASENDRKKLINFIRGWKDGDTSKEARGHMGDMLHSEPLIITYKKGDANGTGKKQYIFAGTNEGYLHAFDTDTGEEKFAFMPKEFLKNIDHQMRNEGTAEDHRYAIDGSINFWDFGEGADRKIYLFFGLRRGGNSYYALDVTNIDQPKFLWKAEYSTMGQSWSSPYLGRIRHAESTCNLSDGKEIANCKEVVVISGGYDDVEDRDGVSPSIDVSTEHGNDILILDAKNGDKLWSLQENGPSNASELVDSIPGGVRILDTNRNGLLDRFYFADTGGHVWRLDLDEVLDDEENSTQLTLLASLAGEGDDARKFYNEPDVSSMKLNGKTIFVVTIGSGFRAHPMDTEIEDKFYMLIDNRPYSRIDDEFETITESKLSLITVSASLDEDTGAGSKLVTRVGGFDSKVDDTDPDSKSVKGWKVVLPEEGEKILGSALVFDGVVVFTTFVPHPLLKGDGIDQCAAPSSQGRLYGINIRTGKPGLDLNGDGVINDNDIFATVSKGEIPGKPQVVFNALEVEDVLDEQGNASGDSSCRHPVDIRIGKKLTQATGYDACRLESLYWSDPANGNK